MIRYLLAAAILATSFGVRAQETGPVQFAGMAHDAHGGHGAAVESPAERATEPGQGAFAAIQEIVSILSEEPDTDWSKVDIDALRRHLVDMSNVTLHADVAASGIENGMRYVVRGRGPVRESIRRMIKAHAQTMNGVNGMAIAAGEHPEGAVMTVTAADPADLPKLQGLGFFGLMTLGMHHQDHHLMIATGRAPHG